MNYEIRRDISSQMTKLDKWAVIDIETTGIDESYDEIIDLGFLQFEGTKLVKKYSSLVRTDKPLSHFIQKLTGITPDMVKNAPSWDKVAIDLSELEEHDLIAHNAAFEKKFLEDSFETKNQNYIDTLSFFGLAFPEKQKLGLEGLLVHFGVTEDEKHRGYEDSRDLLKMMLFTLEYLNRDKDRDTYFRSVIRELDQEHWGWPKFCDWSREDYLEIAEQLEFDVIECVDNYVFKNPENSLDLDSEYLEAKKVFSSETIKEVFDANGEIKKVFPDYQARESQLQMSLRVGQAFGNSIHSLIQAPTGTGKTLAYMLPASLFARSGKGKVLVATGTKTLQEQLMNKDIPVLRKVIGDKFHDLNIVRLVGSSNHFCELLFDENKKDQSEELIQDHNLAFSTAYLKMVFFHNARVASEERILIGQIPYILKMIIPGFSDVVNENKVDFRSCIGSKCPHANRCSYLQGLRDAKEADIIIGNHALMFHWPRGIERPEHIVVDEAHKIEGEASEAYSLSLDQRQFDQLVNTLERGQGLGALFYLLIEEDKEELVDELRSTTKPLNQKLKDLQKDLDLLFESYFKKNSRYTEIYWNELPMIPSDHYDELGIGLRKKIEKVLSVLEEYYELINPYVEKYQERAGKNDTALMAIARFESVAASLEDSYMVLKALLDTDSFTCRQLLYHADSGYLMKATPIDIGKKIKSDLLDQSSSVVFTSATLANKDGSRGTLGVEWMTGYSYLTPERRFKTGLYLDAVFDYKNATQVYLATDTPGLNSVEFIPEVISSLAPIINELGGKTLLLFSSRKRFEQASEKLLEVFDGELNVYIQGMGAHVVESFKQDENAILIGMESFGEGIDIPGDSLQLVYIDKVPDVRMSLLNNERRSFFDQQFGNEFVDYYLAHRTRSLHQKLGRLLRRESDRGAIIITDSRLKRWKGRTIGQFQELMQPYEIQICHLEDACQDALSFIRQQ